MKIIKLSVLIVSTFFLFSCSNNENIDEKNAVYTQELNLMNDLKKQIDENDSVNFVVSKTLTVSDGLFKQEIKTNYVNINIYKPANYDYSNDHQYLKDKSVVVIDALRKDFKNFNDLDILVLNIFKSDKKVSEYKTYIRK